MKKRRASLKATLTKAENAKDELLNMRLAKTIDDETFAEKHTELRDQEARLQLNLEGFSRQQSELADIALKTFELSQHLADQWLTADCAAKRRIIEIVFLNLILDDVTLVPQWRRPFSILAEGPVLETGDPDGI